MEYKVIYSNRKTVGLSIVDAHLVVRAPIGTPKRKIARIVKEHQKWIDSHIQKQVKKQSMLDALSDEDIKRLKKEAKVYFKEKIDYYSKIMGLKYSRVTVTSAMKRFGSCNSNGNICFSYRLMLYPEPAREYVVVHELAHLVEMNHSSKFYKIVESILPDYKKRKRLLK